jgi:4-hydroxythreonine-4-phosphate dehydrogenase
MPNGAMTARIALTMGDPGGIGPEVIEQVLATAPEWREQVCVIGVPQWVEGLGRRFGVHVEATSGLERLQPGVSTREGAAAALEAMGCAAKGCRDGRYGAVVTGPISKHACQQVGMTQAGQTEFFAEQWGGMPTMAFVGCGMVVSLATWHIPLMEVKAALTPEALERTVRHTVDLARKLGVSRPRIAVCGLNPHAGEHGQIGTEERDQLNPVLATLRTSQPGIELSDCLPADTVFYRHLQGEFDAVVALYHDQALGPVKTVAFHDAVNVTCGLPFVRTSPDHGTAFGIAGKGMARCDSMMRALELARRLMVQH